MSRGWQVPEGTTEGTRVEAALETVGVGVIDAGLVGLGDPPLDAEQARLILLMVHVVVVEENPDQTIPVTALALAPAKAVKGMVTVWSLPVRPVTWV